jgi:hypothetical protein
MRMQRVFLLLTMLFGAPSALQAFGNCPNYAKQIQGVCYPPTSVNINRQDGSLVAFYGDGTSVRLPLPPPPPRQPAQNYQTPPRQPAQNYQTFRAEPSRTADGTEMELNSAAPQYDEEEEEPQGGKG